MSKRDYSHVDPLVVQTYELNHKNQTMEYCQKMKKEYCEHGRKLMSLWSALELANEIIDASDPDIGLAQIYHSLQTAEMVKKLIPGREDLQLVGLIHDLGKVMLLDEFGGLPQWSVVGDTFPVGCEFSSEIIFSEFFKENIDMKNPLYNTKFGVYHKGIGFDNVTFSWSHDEYLYSVLKNCPTCVLSDEALSIIRYHSFYPFHKDNQYTFLASEKDMAIKPILHTFSQCDLYSKDSENKMDIDEHKTYYCNLIDKYCPGMIWW